MLKNRIPQVQKIPHFEIKNPEIPQEKWSNTAIPQTPKSPSSNKTKFHETKINISNRPKILCELVTSCMGYMRCTIYSACVTFTAVSISISGVDENKRVWVLICYCQLPWFISRAESAEMKGLSIVQRMKVNSQQRKRHLKQTSSSSF